LDHLVGHQYFEDTKGVVTANTENQLKTKTWAEVAKWHRLFIAREYFTMTATAICSLVILSMRRLGALTWCPGLSATRKPSRVFTTTVSASLFCLMRGLYP
jgi:hypothetical protein